MKRSWVEVSLPALSHNLSFVRSLISPSCQIIAVVKANAYGHGVEGIARFLREEGVSSFGVADVVEALSLRAVLPDAEITVFGGCDPGDESLFTENRLTAALLDPSTYSERLKYQLKINTGMGRLGVSWEQTREVIQKSVGNITGIYSTFASAEVDLDATREQHSRFLNATRGLGIRRHLCNSAGLRLPEAHFEAVRPGLALYGVPLVPELSSLQPALTWKARISVINQLPAGHHIGYGGTFRTARTSRIGVLPVGYADGYNRRLSNQGQVLTPHGYAPIVGLVSMDLTAIDITDYPGIGVGDEVTLLDSAPGSPISALALAKQLNTIPYEILTSIGPRVVRVYRS